MPSRSASRTTASASSPKTSSGSFCAFTVGVIAPGANVAAFAPELARRVGLRVCKLQMLRLASPGFTLPGVVMSDLSLVRYGGFAAQPAAAALQARLATECAAQLGHGVHLIVAQGADGTLVVGDSHHEADFADPFASAAVDHLMLEELGHLLTAPTPRVLERWNGYYPVANVKPVLVDSGFRRGSDVVKALALGATAVGVGRPYAWGLAAFGQPGVEAVLDILRKELLTSLKQLGVTRLSALRPDMVVPA